MDTPLAQLNRAQVSPSFWTLLHSSMASRPVILQRLKSPPTIWNLIRPIRRGRLHSCPAN